MASIQTPGGVEDLIPADLLQGLSDSLSRLAGIPVFFARPDGRLLTRTEGLQAVCCRITTAETVQRPCFRCERMTFGLDGSHWATETDLATDLQCPSGLVDVVIPIRQGERVVALVGTPQVAPDEESRERAAVVLAAVGSTSEEITSFLDGVQTRNTGKLDDIRAAVRAIAELVVTLGGDALQARETATRLDRLARTDELTGLENRRQADVELASAWGLASRHQRPFGVLLLDIDHFKRVNDTLGHAVGDVVLSRLAGLLQRSMRKSDRCFRFGGEEFLVVCHESDERAVSKAGDRIRAAIAHTRFPVGDLPPVTVSIGAAAWPACAVDGPDELVRRADEALYAAKHAGRNRVVGAHCAAA